MKSKRFSIKLEDILTFFPSFQVLATKYPHLKENVVVKPKAEACEEFLSFRNKSGKDWLDWRFYPDSIYIYDLQAENHKGTGPHLILSLFAYLQKNNEKRETVIIDAISEQGFAFYTKLLGFETVDDLKKYFQENGEYDAATVYFELSYDLFFDLLRTEWEEKQQ